MENNNKVNIKALLEQNNIKVNNNEIETDFTKSITNVIDEDSLSQVENAGEEKGVEVNHEDYLSQAGIRGGGVPGNIITAEQMASIEETLKELAIETELAKKEFEEFQKKQE